MLVVNKLRHCSNFLDICILTELISNYAKPALEPIDLKRKAGAGSMLPSSETEPKRFASALNLAKTVFTINARPGLLFFNSQLQWITYQNKESNLLTIGKHYFDALFHDLLLRQVMLQAHTANHFIDKELLQIAKERFESMFMQKLAIHKIEELQTYWQHNSHHLIALKPKKIRNDIGRH